jgi:hypothetical protein
MWQVASPMGRPMDGFVPSGSTAPMVAQTVISVGP